MELRQLEYVVAIAELGSFTGAARRCRVVQSALSHQVARLEHELGTTLFARTSRSVRITAAGSALLPAARQALAAVERGRADVAAVSGEVRGRLTIGAIPTVTALDLPAVIAAFAARHPDVAVGLGAGASDDLAAAVRVGAADVAFVGVPPGWTAAGVREHELGTDTLVAVVPAAHRLRPGRRRRLAEFADETFVDLPGGTAGRRQADQAFARAGLVREVAYEVGSVEFVLDFVAQGLGVGLVPDGYARRGVRGRPDVRIVGLVDAPPRSQRVVWSPGPSPAALAFLTGLGIDPG